MRPIRIPFLYILIAVCFGAFLAGPTGAQAASISYSGTGFFVSTDGYIVTNAHVVRECGERAQVRNNAVPETEAKILATDAASDLALLKVETTPQEVATVREAPAQLTTGEKVMVMGYPKESALSGEYRIEESTIVSDKGPGGEDFWIQFGDSSAQGNSGGPLLDVSGNVIGVITAKARFSVYNEIAAREEQTTTTDVAIALPALKAFLIANRVPYRSSMSQIYMTTSTIENRAKYYIVNVRCRL